MGAVKAGEAYRIECEVWFDGHRYGSTFNSFPHGGEIQIRRGLDGFYWDGAVFTAGETWLATTFDGSLTTDPHHFYLFTVPALAEDGEIFILRMRITGDPITEQVENLVVSVGSGSGGGSGLEMRLVP